MDFNDLSRTRFLVEKVDVLSQDALETPLFLQYGELVVDQAGADVMITVQHGPTGSVIKPRVTLKYLQIEDLHTFRVVVETILTPKVGEAR